MIKLLIVVFAALMLSSCVYVETKTHTWDANSDNTTVYRELVLDKDLIKAAILL